MLSTPLMISRLAFLLCAFALSAQVALGVPRPGRPLESAPEDIVRAKELVRKAPSYLLPEGVGMAERVKDYDALLEQSPTAVALVLRSLYEIEWLTRLGPKTLEEARVSPDPAGARRADVLQALWLGSQETAAQLAALSGPELRAALGTLSALGYERSDGSRVVGKVRLDKYADDPSRLGELVKLLGLGPALALSAAIQEEPRGAALFAFENDPKTILEAAGHSSQAELTALFRQARDNHLPEVPRPVPAEKRSILAAQQPRDKAGRFVGMFSREHKARVSALRDPPGIQDSDATRLFRGDPSGDPRRATAQVFAEGIRPLPPRGHGDWIAHLVNSKNSDYTSATSSATYAHVYVSGWGTLYAIDRRKVPSAERVDDLIHGHRGLFHEEDQPIFPVRGAPTRRVLVGPNGEVLLNRGTGEWIAKGGIPASAVVSATLYQKGKAIAVLKNPNYRP